MSLSIGGAPSAAAWAPASAGTALTPTPAETAKDEFLKWASMTPAQRMRAQLLASMGLTEDQLKAMDPDKRKAIEEKMAKEIKDKLVGDPANRDKTGLLADVTA